MLNFLIKMYNIKITCARTFSRILSSCYDKLYLYPYLYYGHARSVEEGRTNMPVFCFFCVKSLS